MKRSLAALLTVAVVLSLIGVSSQGQEKKVEKKVEKKPPMPSQPATHAKVAYGKHERQVLDFYQAESKTPTPLVVFIHGGSWTGGDKDRVGSVKPYMDAGISVASINYRYVTNGVQEKIMPPVKAPLEDAARAVQFLRSKAAEWNIDKKKVGLTGGSAGACSSLWLAFHDDLADPKSDDPIARESTRVACAAVSGAQTSLDPKQLREWLPNYIYGSHAFGLKGFQELYEKREMVLPWIKEYSPIEHVTKDDPPIGLYYGGVAGAKVGEEHPDPTHSPIMGVKLAEKLRSVGVDVVLSRTGSVDSMFPTPASFLIDRLKK